MTKNNKTIYKARIEFDAVEDNYEEGEIGRIVNYWTEEIVRDTPEMLKMAVVEATYQDDFSTIDDEQINEYDWCSEYATSYLANEDNQGAATPSEIESWKKGELKLYAIHCHVLVTKLTESKASLL